MPTDYSKLLNGNALKAIRTYINNNAIHTIMSASSVAGSTTSGSQLSVRWYVSGINSITAPFDGMKISIKIPRVGNSSGVVLSINGNTNADYHPVLYNASLLTSHYAAGLVKVLVYDASASATVYLSSGTAISITGCWKCEGDYNTNSTSYLSNTSTALTSGTTATYLLGKQTTFLNSTTYYNSNVYFCGDGSLHATTLYENGSALSALYQPLDADLTAIAGLTGTSGFLKKTAANTWTLDTNTYLTLLAAQGLLTPTLVGQTLTTSGINGYNGISIGVGLRVLPSDVKGLFIFTYGNCMVLLPIYGLTENTEYKVAAALVNSGGSYATKVLTYRLTLVGKTATLQIYNKENYIPTGYGAAVYKIPLY